MVNGADEKALFQFPCRYVLKITALAAKMSLEALLAILQPHIPAVSATDVTVKNSSQGNYVSFSVSFMAQSKEQLDALYRDLTTRKEIVFVL